MTATVINDYVKVGFGVEWYSWPEVCVSGFLLTLFMSSTVSLSE